MSKSVSPPWIADYVIGVAQEHGANTSAIKACNSRKKVQVIGILHYGSANLDEDSIIWASVSDKKNHIPVKFSQESVAKYRRDNNQRFTENKTSLITLQKYRLIHTRIPIDGPSRLSPEPRLALDCTEFCLIGSCGEEVWEQPKSVEDYVSDIRLWTAGLRKGGGDGNVLRDRKNGTEQNPRERQVKILLPEGHGSPRPQPRPDVTAPVQETSSCKYRSFTSNGKGKIKEVREDTFGRKRERHWERYRKYPERYSMRPEGWKEIANGLSIYGEVPDILPKVQSPAKPKPKRFHPLDLGSSQPSEPPLDQAQTEHLRKARDPSGPFPEAEQEETSLIGSWPSQQATPPPSEPDLPIDRERSATPLKDWPNTDNEEEQEEAPVLDSASQNSPQPPSLLAPTPAQRKRVDTLSSQDTRLILEEEEIDKSGLPVASSPEMPKVLHSDDGQRSSVSPVKYSTSSSLVSHIPGTQTVAYLSSSFEMGLNVRRRVPPPRQPVDLPRSELPVILAPPSDTSGSQEQSQGRSQGWRDELLTDNNLELDAEDRAGLQNESRSVQHQRHLPVCPAPAAVKVKPNEDLVIPETQPERAESETRDEDEVEVGDTRTEEYSMDVHPGTLALPDMDVEGDEEDDHLNSVDQPRDGHDESVVDRVYRERIYCHARTEIFQRYPKGAGEAGHEADDEQTLTSLFGVRRRGVELSYDPAEWVKPSFMVSHEARKKAHHEQPSAGVASSSNHGPRRENVGAPLPTDTKPHTGTHGHDNPTKGKKRARTGAFDDIEHVGEHVERSLKRTRVKHDADPARACHNSTGGRAKLNGFSIDLEGMKADEPWKMSWERLGTILLKTGRERVRRLKK